MCFINANGTWYKKKPNFQYQNNYQQRPLYNNQQGGYQAKQNYPQGFTNQGNQSPQTPGSSNQAQAPDSSVDSMFKKLLEFQAKNEKTMALESQVASMPSSSKQPMGSLPGKPEKNPKESCNVVFSTTSSEIELSDHEEEEDEIERLVFETEFGEVERFVVATAEAQIVKDATKKVEATNLQRDEHKAEKQVEKRADNKLKEVKLEEATEVELSPYDKLPFPQRVLTKAQKKVLSKFRKDLSDVGAPPVINEVDGLEGQGELCFINANGTWYKKEPNFQYQNNYQQRPLHNNQQGGYQAKQNYPQGFTNQGNQSPQTQGNSSQAQAPDSSVDSMFKKLLEFQVKNEKTMVFEFKNIHTKIDENYSDLNNKYMQLASLLKALESQVASMPSSSKQPMGSLPGKPEKNPKESCNVVFSTASSEIELSDHEKEEDEIERLVFGTEFGEVERFVVVTAEAQIVKDAARKQRPLYNNQQRGYQAKQNYPQGFTNQGNQSPQTQGSSAQAQAPDSGVDSMFKKLLEFQARNEKTMIFEFKNIHTKIDENYSDHKNKFLQLASHFKALESQVASMSASSKQPMGSLPGKPEKNFKESCNVVFSTTSSEIELSDDEKEEDEIERLVFGTEFGEVKRFVVATPEAQIVKSRLDTASNGFFLGRTEEDAEELVENMAKSDSVYSDEYDRSNRGDDQHTMKELKSLEAKLDLLLAEKAKQEKMNFVGDQKQEAPPVINENNQQGGYQAKQNYPQGFTNQGNQSPQTQGSSSQAQAPDSSVDSMFKKLLEFQARNEKTIVFEFKNIHTKIDENYSDLNNKFLQLASHFKALESQVASMHSSSKQPMGSLPGKPEKNPKESCNVVFSTTSSEIKLSDHEKEEDEIERLVFGIEFGEVERFVVATAEEQIVKDAARKVEATNLQRAKHKAETQNYPQGFTNQGNQSPQTQGSSNQAQAPDSSVDSMFKRLLEFQARNEKTMVFEFKNIHTKIDENYSDLNNKFLQFASHFKALESQVAYMPSSSKQPMGSLPGKPEKNPNESCNVVFSTTSSEIKLSDHEKEEDEIERLVFGTEFGEVERFVVATGEAQIVKDAARKVEATNLQRAEHKAEKQVF
ncbi:hypothetical protein F2Q68_00005725 [Brassica cretica]|uniref:Uncharacterized protein n=1 Tax=Brassica cretica TaxID=69181 RepID=A0A8S9JHB6_BRACR|nr:hypothetical protein F2Q68_00005725 [Brassica cretica]